MVIFRLKNTKFAKNTINVVCNKQHFKGITLLRVNNTHRHGKRL